jgi:hypothetical protein
MQEVTRMSTQLMKDFESFMETIGYGTVVELKGEGTEYLVDAETRTVVLAKFVNGEMVLDAKPQGNNDVTA